MGQKTHKKREHDVKDSQKQVYLDHLLKENNVLYDSVTSE